MSKDYIKISKKYSDKSKIVYIYNDQNQINEKTIIYCTDFLFSYRFC